MLRDRDDIDLYPVPATAETAKLAELDRILNDPTVPIDPDRVWTLIGEIARAEQAQHRRPAADV